MRARHIRWIAAASLALLLSGCESFDIGDLLPSSKKPLPGERRDVFPEGVPGVTQGVPRELVRGYQPPAEPAVVEAPPEPAPEQRAARPQGRPSSVSQAAGAPQEPAPRRRAQAPRPQPEAQQQAPAQQSQSAAPWPAPPPPTPAIR